MTQVQRRHLNLKAKKIRLRQTITRRRIEEGHLHHFCDLAQALHHDDRSKKRPNATVEQQIALYHAGQAK